MSVRFVVFPTPLGPCALGFGPAGIRCVELPAARDEAARSIIARVLRRLRGEGELVPLDAAPPGVARVVELLKQHLGGSPTLLHDAPLDLSGLPPFHARLYEALRQVPPGQTVTYGELAARAGSAGAARAVGQAMAKNPMPLLVPCHRVLASGGREGGFSAPGGTTQKRELLALEGVALEAPPRGARGKNDAETAPEAPRQSSLKNVEPFDADEACRTLAAADPVLGALMERVGPYGLTQMPARETFDALAVSIVHQQLSGKAAATILGRFRELFPPPFPTPELVARARVTTLRKAGLSEAKALALKDLARHCTQGTVPRLARLRRMPDDEVIATLTQVRGIGQWTVEMLLMFRLDRRDVLPLGDLGVRKGFQLAFGLREMPTPRELEAHGERWRPFRSVASWYLWRAVDEARSREAANAAKAAT